MKPDQSSPSHSPLAVTLLVAATAFMQLLDGSVIAPAIPDMARSFHVEPVSMSIGISAYMITVGIFIPVTGWMARKFGSRRVFMAAIAVFTLASALCGLSTSLPEFVLARIAQGIGGAMMVPVGRLVVMHLSSKEDLLQSIAIMTWPALVAPVLGPPVGGFISVHASWHWIFYLNIPLGLVALLLSARIMPRIDVGKAGLFDSVGFVLTGFALFSLLFAAEALGQNFGSPILIFAMAIAGLVSLLAGWRHLQRAPNPLMGLSPLSHQTFRASFRGGTAFRLGVNAIPFLIPILFQDAFGWNAFSAGLILMAVFAGNLAIKPFTTPILRRFGFRTVLLVNGALNSLFIASLWFLRPGTPLSVMVGLLFLAGMSRSMQFTAYNSLSFAEVGTEETADANTLSITGRQLGAGLGVAVGAIGWRLGEAMFPHDGALPYHVAFLMVAALSTIGLIDCYLLPKNAGEEVTRGRKKA